MLKNSNIICLPFNSKVSLYVIDLKEDDGAMTAPTLKCLVYDVLDSKNCRFTSDSETSIVTFVPSLV